MASLPGYAVPRSALLRLLAASRGQRERTPRCPETPRLDGALAVVTGATGGIGFEIARGLARRGASLLLPCRSRERGERAAEALRAEGGEGATVELVEMELSDLVSVRSGAKTLAKLAGGRSVDLLVENAGIWPRGYARTRQGVEIAFGVNVLAHFALRRELAAAGALDRGRVVVLTGDLYCLARDCTPHFRYRGPLGGMRAYCRSKLGNLWIAFELARRRPELSVRAAHPGVVATGLGGGLGSLGNAFRRRLFLPPELGAQTPLLCATRPELESGGYWHNVYGRMRLPPGDPARDTASAARLWDACERLASA